MRLFVGVFPPAEAIADLAKAMRRLSVFQAGARVTPPERWHLTVAFLGEVAEESAPAALRAVEAVPLPPIELSLHGGGKFGRGFSTVLWTGLDGDVERLSQVARALRRELRARRLPTDDKPFRGHLTIARPGRKIPPDELAADIELLREYAGPSWPLRELVLVRSELGPNPTYHRFG